MSDILYFEEFKPGRIFECGPYAVTKEEILAFAREFDPQPHHLDEEAAMRSMLGTLSASGWHTCAMAMRMMCDGVLLRAASRGGAGAPEARWLKPVRPGDVLRMEAEVVTAKEARSKPIGFVDFACRVFNAQEQVALVRMTPIFEKRGA